MSKKLLFILLSLGTVAGIMGAIIWAIGRVKVTLTNNMVSLYAEQEKLMAEETAKTLELEVSGVEEKLKLIARIPEIRDGDTDVCNAKLQEIFATMKTKVGNLGRIGKDGKFTCSLNAKLIGLPGASLGPYVTTIFNDPLHNPVMSRVILPPGSDSYVVAVHVPVYDKNGDFSGTLGGAIYFKDLIQKYFSDVRFAKQGYIVLVDDDGFILYTQDQSRIGKNALVPNPANGSTPSVFPEILAEINKDQTGIKEYVAQNKKKIAAYTPANVFPDRRWVVLVTVPIEDVYTQLVSVGVEKIFRNLIIGIAIAIIFFILGFVMLMVRTLFNPLTKIRIAAKRIGTGDLDTRVDITSHDEIGQVAETMNIMTSRLKELYTGLETKVHERTRQLEESNIKLQQLDKLKDEFVSVASHELRTPMGAIKAFISMIFEGDYGPVNKKLQEPLNDIRTSADRLIHLVNDMLDVTRIEAGRIKFELRNVDISDAVKEVVDSLIPLAREKKLRLVMDKTKAVQAQGDSDKVKQIVANLIGNALKFTTKGSISVRVNDKGDVVEVEVADTGIGIPEESVHKLFGKFERVGSDQKDRPIGTGLGLYISRQLAQKMGGDLILKSSQINRGSVFMLLMPKQGTSGAIEALKQIGIEAGEHPDQK